MHPYRVFPVIEQQRNSEDPKMLSVVLSGAKKLWTASVTVTAVVKIGNSRLIHVVLVQNQPKCVWQ